MQNVVPAVEASLTAQAAARSLADRHEVYEHEMQALVDATYVVMRKTGSIEPRVSDIVPDRRAVQPGVLPPLPRQGRAAPRTARRRAAPARRDLEHRMAGARRCRCNRFARWVEGVLEQARDPDAAATTRPFALNGEPARDAVPRRDRGFPRAARRPAARRDHGRGGDARRDADAVYHLTMGTMQDALGRSVTPSKRDVEHLVQFALGGINLERELLRHRDRRPGGAAGRAGARARGDRSRAATSCCSACTPARCAA